MWLPDDKSKPSAGTGLSIRDTQEGHCFFRGPSQSQVERAGHLITAVMPAQAEGGAEGQNDKRLESVDGRE